MSADIVILSTQDHVVANQQALYLAAVLAEEGYRVAFAGPLADSAIEYLEAKEVEPVYVPVRWPLHRERFSFFAHYIFLWLLYIFNLLRLLPRDTGLIIGIEASACRAAWLLRRLGWTRHYACYLLEVWDRWLKFGGVRGRFNRSVWNNSEFVILSNEARSRLFEKMKPHFKGRTITLHNVQPLDWLKCPPLPVSQVNWPLTLGYVGSIAPRTGLPLLLDGIAAAPREVRLLIGGVASDPAYLDKVKALTTELGIDERVSFVGEVPRHALPELIERTHATVCFYPWRNAEIDTNVKLCAPNKVYESLAMGRAVVASDNPTLTFLVEQRLGWTVNLTEPTELVSLIATLARDPQLIIETGQRARRAYEEAFNYEIESRPVRRIIRKLLDRNPSPEGLDTYSS